MAIDTSNMNTATNLRRRTKKEAKGSDSTDKLQSTSALSSSKGKEDDRATKQQEQRKVLSRNDNDNDHHLPPIILTLIVFTCSSIVFIFCLRDFITTGKTILGSIDDAYLQFTKSTQWYNPKTMGGITTAIQPVSTDSNNMGGFFVRKVTGSIGCIVQLHKILPLVFVHERNAQWSIGHYQPILLLGMISNVILITFYALYSEDLIAAKAQYIPYIILLVLGIETITMFVYYIKVHFGVKRSLPKKLAPVVAIPNGKTETSFVSNITTRTTCIVTTLIMIIAIRDLFFPGYIIELFPRDDIYLEWTNAFYHSPQRNTPEYNEYKLVSPLYIGDKFISQLGAIHLLLLCMYKYYSTLLIRVQKDGYSGTIQTKMIWRVSCIGDVMLFACCRLFVHAANTASYNMKFHLIFISYEAIMFGLNGYM